MAGPFDRPVRHVVPGSPVTASNTSAAPRELEVRTNYLHDRLDAAAAGEALFRFDVPLAPTLQVGQPVYWNATNARYEAAILAVGTDSNGQFQIEESADVAGIVFSKTGASSGVLLVDGTARISSLEAAVSGTITPGRYFLSASTAGAMSTARPTPAVQVLRVLEAADACGTSPLVSMARGADDLLADHVHRMIDLYTQPAGDYTPPAEGETHEITDGDSDLPGWLPADDESFDGHAPTGAKFGYNLLQHEELRSIWPPFPLESVVVVWDRGDGNGSSLLTGQETSPALLLDEHGLWWMSDCYGDVPWPIDYGVSESLSLSDDCPRDGAMRLTLFCIHMLTANDRTVVTSLQAAEGSPLTVTDLAGDAAATGNLKIDFDPTLVEDPDEAYGGEVVKDLTASPFGFTRGYVLEGLYTENARVTLTGTRHRRLTPGDNGTPWVEQGVVEIDVDVEPGDRMLMPATSYLAGVRQDEYQGISYLGFPNGQLSTVRYTFYVPYDGLPASPEFSVRMRLFGLANGPMSNLDVGYMRLTNPATLGTTLPSAFTPLAFDLETASTGVTSGKELKVDTDAISIAAGDTIVIEVSRASDASPSYAATIGLIRVDGLITAG